MCLSTCCRFETVIYNCLRALSASFGQCELHNLPRMAALLLRSPRLLQALSSPPAQLQHVTRLSSTMSDAQLRTVSEVQSVLVSPAWRMSLALLLISDVASIEHVRIRPIEPSCRRRRWTAPRTSATPHSRCGPRLGKLRIVAGAAAHSERHEPLPDPHCRCSCVVARFATETCRYFNRF